MIENNDIKSKSILIIVESPNKQKTISAILKNAGYKHATVMASVGHISQIKDERASFKNSGIYPKDNFRMNLAVTDDKKQVVKNLKEHVAKTDLVFLMSDPDREGSQIAWSLVKFLNLKPDKYYRVVTHEITPKAVIYAIEHPIPLETNLIEAAQTRMILDKLVGYTLSPIAKKYVGARSVGRCQSAGLKLICDREKEIQEFIPASYYDLYLQFVKNNQEYRAKYLGTLTKEVNKIESDAEIVRIKHECSGEYIVNEVSKKERFESPKPPFCTASFQQEVSTKIGLKVKDAMSIAQKLFEGIKIDGEHVGLITYHRTDSTSFAPEFIPTLQNFINSEYAGQFTYPIQGKKADTDQDGHECLRCIDPYMTPDKLSAYITNELQLKVYKLIWQRTIAAAMPKAKYEDTNYTIENNGHLFSLGFSNLTSAGFKIIYGNTPEQYEIKTDFLVKDEKLQQCELDFMLKTTTPPARYKEASLIKELQKRAIGRPSTYATILETVLSTSRGYCELNDKYLVPTPRGMQLSAFLDRAFSSIINLEYTKVMEEALDLIADGKLNKIDFLNSFFIDLETAIANNTEDVPEKQEVICPKCGAKMAIRRSKFGKLFYGCSNYPNCNGIVNLS